MIDPKNIFVIVPTYNEGLVIKNTVEELLTHLYNVVVVDDGSTDKTYETVSEYPIHYLRHSVNLGQGAALQTGMTYCQGIKEARFIVHFDADGQHSPKNILPSIQFMEEGGYDIILGSRFLNAGDVKNIPLLRKIILNAGRVINWLFYGLLLTDSHNGFRVLSKRALTKINLRENRSAHASEILGQVTEGKLKYSEFPIQIRYTKYSLSKGQSSFNAFNIFLDLIIRKLVL